MTCGAIPSIANFCSVVPSQMTDEEPRSLSNRGTIPGGVAVLGFTGKNVSTRTL
jgi:hypothetical protein